MAMAKEVLAPAQNAERPGAKPHKKTAPALTEWLAEGRSCSQCMMLLAMQALGIEDENLLHAMKGLSGGMGIGHVCGIVTRRLRAEPCRPATRMHRVVPGVL